MTEEMSIINSRVPGDVTSLKEWFCIEIRNLMHGLGDCHKPLTESASMIESIVHDQVKLMLREASDVVELRNASYMGIEDFVFLLRNSKEKLRRLLLYLDIKDKKDSTFRNLCEDPERENLGTKVGHKGQKRLKIAMDFLSVIDNTGELTSFCNTSGIDSVKYLRMLRADRQSRCMSQDQYQDFCESRQTNFSKKQIFKEWLLRDVNINTRLGSYAFEVMAYLTYETIAQIIDMALIVKQDKLAESGDPVKGVRPPTYKSYSEVSHANELLSKEMDTLSAPAGNNSADQPSVRLSTSNDGQTIKSDMYQNNVCVGESLQGWQYDAILPSEIREAIRRYNQLQGPFSSYQFSEVPPHQFLLCS